MSPYVSPQLLSLGQRPEFGPGCSPGHGRPLHFESEGSYSQVPQAAPSGRRRALALDHGWDHRARSPVCKRHNSNPGRIDPPRADGGTSTPPAADLAGPAKVAAPPASFRLSIAEQRSALV